ncbi:hypothetical protein SRHO_G00067060 [Serrasalmus rhombeus]
MLTEKFGVLKVEESFDSTCVSSPELQTWPLCSLYETSARRVPVFCYALPTVLTRLSPMALFTSITAHASESCSLHLPHILLRKDWP